jgi:hypothetical protein
MIAPLKPFVDAARPAKYAPVTMEVHMETTIQNLEIGIGAWDEDKQKSCTENYLYIDGQDPKEAVRTT